MTDSPELGEPTPPVTFSEQATLPPLPAPPGPSSRSRRARPQPDGSNGKRPNIRQARGRRPKSAALRRPFRDPRLTDQIGFWRRLRSVMQLIAVSVILGLLLAAIVAAVVGGIVVAIQNALNA